MSPLVATGHAPPLVVDDGDLPHGIPIAGPMLCQTMVRSCGNGQSPLQSSTHVAQVFEKKTVPDLMTAFWSSCGAKMAANQMNFVFSCICKDDTQVAGFRARNSGSIS